MVMRKFHPLLRDATKDTRDAGRLISLTNLLKVSGLGDKMTISDSAPPYQYNTYMIAVLNGRFSKTCKLDHHMISDTHAKHLLQQVGKWVYIITEELQRSKNKIKVEPVKQPLQ